MYKFLHPVNNGSEQNNFIVSGKIEGDSFLIKTVKKPL